MLRLCIFIIPGIEMLNTIIYIPRLSQKITNLSEDDIHVLEWTLGKYLKHRLDQLSEEGKDVEEVTVILKEIRKRLQEAHKLRDAK